MEKTVKIVYSECMLRLVVMRVFVLFVMFVFVRTIGDGDLKLDLSSLLQHFIFEHVFNL